MKRPLYSWRKVADRPVIVVIDEAGPGDAVPSVTNAAEVVIADLVAEGFRLDELAVIYRDSEGDYDRLETRAGKFAGFRGIRETDEELAIAKAVAQLEAEQGRRPFELTP